MSRARWIAACAVLATLGGTLLVAAEGDAPEPAARPLAGPPAFRRIFLPEAEIKNQSWNTGYLPIDRKEFEQLLETLQANAAGAPGARPAHLDQAEYSAKLVGEDLLVGSGKLQLVRRAASSASMLDLFPCSLAVGAATWREDTEQEGPPSNRATKTALIGQTIDGHLRLLADGSKLDFAWSQRGERTAAGAIGFHLELPECPMARLTLDVPEGWELLSNRGVVSKGPGPEPKVARWTIELGGHNRVDLRLVSEETARDRRPLTLLRQSLIYEFSTRGIYVTAQLTLDVHGEPLGRVAVDLDPSLSLVAARYGEQDVPWSVVSDVETRMSHVVLQMPEAIAGTGRVLRLRAMAPLTTGKMWRLPGLQTESVSWQEGVATLLIPSSFTLEQLATIGCRQSRVSVLPGPLQGESIEIQYYRPWASIEVLLEQPHEAPKIDCGTQIEVGATEVTSRTTVQVSLAQGQRSAAQFALSPGWVVDGVDNATAKTPIEWEVDESQPGGAVLKLRFDRAVTPTNTARLVVRGHRPLPTGPVFEGGQLAMLSFAPFRAGTRLINVRAAEGLELRWTHSEDLQRRDTVELQPNDLQLFAQPPTGLLFVDDAAFAHSSLALERRRPSYTADIRVDAAVQPQQLTETYTIQCVPERARVERLLVHFSQPRDVPLEWNLAGGNSGQFSARRMSAAEQVQSALPPGGEVWELILHLARSGPFEVRAVRSIPFTEETPVSLASVADATTQRGTLAIRALGDVGLSIRNRRLTSVPAELVDTDRYQTARATYRYQPSRDDLGTEAAVSILPAESRPSETGAWAWNCRLESHYAVGGPSTHWASLRVQTAGQQKLRVSLADGAEVHGMWLDGKPLPGARLNDAHDGQWPIELPPGRSFATLTVYFSTPEGLPTLVAGYRPPYPTLVDVPMISREWSVWLPPNYEIVDANDHLTTGALVPPGWRERLFGPFGRTSSGKVFNPLAADDWRALFGGAPEGNLAHGMCDQFVRMLGQQLAEYEDAEELTWGQLLSASDDADGSARDMILLDTAALDAIGLQPHSRVRLPEDTNFAERGRALLREMGLALMADASAVILTSRANTPSYARQLNPLSDGVGCTILPGPLADELRAIAQQTSGGRFATVESWLARPERGENPWSDFAAADSPGASAGWFNYTLQYSEEAVPAIRVVHVPAMYALAWSLFLGIVGVGLWQFKSRPYVWILLIALSAAACLFLPASYLPLSSATLMAALVCLAVRLIELPDARRRPADASRASHKHRSDAAHPVATALLTTLILALSQTVSAWQPQPAAPGANVATAPSGDKAATSAGAAPLAAAPTSSNNGAAVDRAAKNGGKPQSVERVFVPVDAANQPSGDKYYISTDFFRQLHRQAALASGQPEGFLITRGLYQGTLSRDPVTKRLGVTQLKATYDLAVLGSNVQVRLPLPRESTPQAIVAARLEGRPLALNFNAAGTELNLGTLAADRYRLELDLAPPQQADAATGGFEMPIPPLANSTLELTLPADAPVIELPTARGQVRVLKERGQLVAQLGATDRLAARWPLGVGAEAASPNMEVEELLWLKVRPGTTVLDAKFKYRVLAGRTRQIRLLTDPRLRLLPGTAAQSPIAAVHTIPGDPQRIDLEFARDVTDQVVVDLSFLVTGTSGVGYLRLPRLESNGVRTTKRWLAAWVDPALQSKVQAGEDSKSLDLADFVAAWGASDLRPQAAYGIPRGEPMWGLATEPNEPRVEVEQSLAVSLGRSTSLIQFEADLSISGGYLFQLGLQSPKDLTVEQISIQEDGMQLVAARWSVDDTGRISVFLNAPINGKQTLLVTGRSGAAPDSQVTLPQIKLLGAETKDCHVHIYRQPSVLVETTPAAGVTPLDPAATSPREGFGAPVGGLALADPTTEVTVKVSPNVVEAHSVAATFLHRDADRWLADFEYHVDVTEGLVDTLEFEIPPQWSEPFRAEPAAKLKIVPIPGEQRRQLIVSPERPISGKFQLKLRGRLSPFSAGVPDIVPLGVQQVERFVVLPQRLDLQQVTWDTFGLSRASLPADFVSHAPNLASMAVYQVAGEHFQASLKTVQHGAATARVLLADMRILWQADDRFQGLASFDLEPGGASSCVLELPSGAKLVHASIESLPALMTPQGNNRWRLALGPQQLPERLEVVYQAPLAYSGWGYRFQAPRLVDLPVTHTLWTICGPSQVALGLPRQSSIACTAAEQDLERLKSITTLAQLPAEASGELLPDEIARWYRPWKNRYSATRGVFDWRMVASRQNTAQAAEAIEARALDVQMNIVDARLGSASPGGLQARSDEFADLLGDICTDLVPAHYSLRGASYELELRPRQPATDSWGGRLFSGLAILVGGIGMAYVARSRPMPVLAAWLVLGTVGVAWWLFLAPSVVGLIALVLAIWAAVRVRWQGAVRLRSS